MVSMFAKLSWGWSWENSNCMQKTDNTTLSVAAIKNGTVIDHITAGHALRIVRLLNLSGQGNTVTVGLNLPSRQLTQKDLIKVENRELTPNEANEIAILSPHATINIIKNYTVTKKFSVTLPGMIEGVIVCPNPACITNHEKMPTKFRVEANKKMVQVRCQYCEKSFRESDIKNYRPQ